MPLWIDDPKVLLSTAPEDWNPLCGTTDEKINATTKLTLLVAIGSSIKRKDHKIFLRTVIVLGVVMVLYVGLDTRKGTFSQKKEVAAVAPVTAAVNPASASVQAAMTNVVPTDDIMGSARMTRPFYKTPDDDDRFKEKMYGDSFKCQRKQSSVYSHLACPSADCSSGRHGFSGVGGESRTLA